MAGTDPPLSGTEQPSSSSNKIKEVSRPGPDAERWDARARDLKFNELPNIQAKASQWMTVITALAGLFAALLFVRGPADISKLTVGWQIVVAVVTLAGLGAFLAGMICAALAAEGTLSKTYAAGPTIRTLYETEAPSAASRLKFSRVVTIVGVMLITLSVLLAWIGPKPPTAASTVIVLERSGTVLCGTLKTDQAGRVSLNPPNSDSTVLISDVVSITLVTACS